MIMNLKKQLVFLIFKFRKLNLKYKKKDSFVLSGGLFIKLKVYIKISQHQFLQQ